MPPPLPPRGMKVEKRHISTAKRGKNVKKKRKKNLKMKKKKKFVEGLKNTMEPTLSSRAI
jgi:hypothetical protein